MTTQNKIVKEFEGMFVKGENENTTLNVPRGTLSFIVEVEDFICEVLSRQREEFRELVEKKLENARERYREFGLQSIEGEISALDTLLATLKNKE